MKEWSFDEAVKTITRALLDTVLAKEVDLSTEEAALVAMEIAKALEDES